MKAGPEMDKMIAGKVMGFVCYRKIGCELCEPKPYSTDIAAAWEVVEKLRQDGHWMTLEDDDIWDCCFTRKVGKIKIGFAEADTVPLSICLAALKVVR